MTTLIDILFDVSGSMESPFDKINFSLDSSAKSNELTKILKNLSKNYDVKLFSELFGGKKYETFDFLGIIKLFDKILKSINNGRGREDFYSLIKYIDPKTEIGKYLFSYNGPSDELCSFGVNLMDGDIDLIKKVYDNLPRQVKSIQYDIKITEYPILSFLGSLDFLNIGKGMGNVVRIAELDACDVFSRKRVDKAVIDGIKDSFKIVVEKLSMLLKREINNDKTLTSKEFLIMGRQEIETALKSIDSKIALPDRFNGNILNFFSNIIYGKTPLYKACENAFTVFEKNNTIFPKKLMIIISDGKWNDYDPKNLVKQKCSSLNVYVVGCFLSDQNVESHRLFSDDFNFPDDGSKSLFSLCSKINYQNPIFRFFLRKNWKLPESGECRLFVNVNNSENLKEFTNLINEAINYRDPHNNLIDLLANCYLKEYVNSLKGVKAKNQIFGTCWANACAAVVYMAQKSVYGRKVESFEYYRQYLITHNSYYGREGQNLEEALNRNNFLRI